MLVVIRMKFTLWDVSTWHSYTFWDDSHPCLAVQALLCCPVLHTHCTAILVCCCLACCLSGKPLNIPPFARQSPETHLLHHPWRLLQRISGRVTCCLSFPHACSMFSTFALSHALKAGRSECDNRLLNLCCESHLSAIPHDLVCM